MVAPLWLVVRDVSNARSTPSAVEVAQGRLCGGGGHWSNMDGRAAGVEAGARMSPWGRDVQFIPCASARS
jgi:hypothetical protein